ncbi:MAG: hypothetical protein PUB37_00045 [Firmicutes bacterium]|nr:hypothetical protein [Bacillota bacterium]
MGRNNNNNNNNNNPLETLGTLAIIYYLVKHFKEVGLFVVCLIIIFSVMFIFKIIGQILGQFAEQFFSVVDLGWWFLGLIAILVMFILIHKYCVPNVKNFRYYRVAAMIFGCIFIAVGIALLVRDYMWFIEQRDKYCLIYHLNCEIDYQYDYANYCALSSIENLLLPLNALGVSLINGGIVVIIDGCVTAARRLKKLANTVNNNLK